MSPKVVIVDLEGTANMRVSYAVSQSDLVLIPVKPSMLDAKEAAKAIALVRRTEVLARRKIDYAVLFSQTPAAFVTKNFKDISSQFKQLEVPILNVQHSVLYFLSAALFTPSKIVKLADFREHGLIHCASRNQSSLGLKPNSQQLPKEKNSVRIKTKNRQN